MISYRCPCCGSDDEQFHHRVSEAPASVPCRGFRFTEPKTERIEHQITNTDGTVTIEYEEVELAPVMELCTGTSMQRVSLPGELWARPARGFAPLVVYERPDHEHLPNGINRYYIPGRNDEPTEAGMKRIELTNMAEYNRWVKEANTYETQKMRDHRAMHEYYWRARRKALREDVDARVGPMRSHPLVKFLSQTMRARSDQKTARRYGKPLDAHFHSQLMEFDQGNMQDHCSEDTRWRSTRAK